MDFYYHCGPGLCQQEHDPRDRDCFATGRGGSTRGGATLTALGRTTLTRYRALQKAIDKTAASDRKKLTSDLAP